ncbi:MAG: hybrid sensor histidine kinase/response regulator [Jaaginema sp. PMC 1079.18]|nr:hybrid sensor histidine kinase/response regulator [Jaaginema sp. PMC 1080.18]MEC4850751.1 hybrid sensor histidine kinase/response regulator [Jaaginema sp. PMC 1079.18]MEC4865667.1 hybrid sensor histidine kinase/response regulator [Jaaginema sp. PMC 1078.18]
MSLPLILIVDDNPTNLKVLSYTLMNEGFELAIATDGTEALAQIAEEKPALILLDVMMPGIDGFETCRRLKANRETEDIPVIFMTALSDTVDKVKGLSIGAVDYISKPFEAVDVLARIRVHLRLQAAQKRMLAQEKLAALGTLAAGIAHELRNPLNFVANYAEIAVTNLTELLNSSEISQSPETKHLLQEVREDINSIYHHSQRAEQTIKSMMQLARRDRQPHWEATVLDILLNQATQLAYQSFRARYPEFSLEIVTDYDPTVETIWVVPSDFSRAAIALVDNACYALYHKQKQQATFQPQLHLKTRAGDRSIKISLRDNGSGIPAKLTRHLFDPFVTTKPPGEGTGLGLSLAQNIIVEQHGGNLTFHSEIGQYTEFTIALPCQPHP